MNEEVEIVPQQDEQPSDDKIYAGYNFSAMRRELTLDKVWHRRTWGEIFKHFFTALIISAIPTFYDMFTDSYAAKSFIQGANYTKYVTNLSDPAFHENCVYLGRNGEYEEIECFETDVIWGGVTVLLIFLPGTFFAGYVSRIISDLTQNKVGCCTLYWPLLLPSMLCFPVVLILAKLVGLITPGPEWKGATIWLTSMEGELESSLQLLLTLFFSRADRKPAWWQVASLVASMVLVTKTSIAHHLRFDGLSAKEELKKSAFLLPLFLSNTSFKILSLAISLALLRHWAFLVSFLLPIIFIGCVGSKWGHLYGGAQDHLTNLVMIYNRIWIKTMKQRMTNCVFNYIVWICTHAIVLTALVVAANCYPDTYVYNLNDLVWEDESTNNTSLPLTNTTQASINATTFNSTMDDPGSIGDQVLHSFFDGYQLSSRALVQNLPLLNGLYVGILVTIALHGGLFYWQIWKPFENNDEVDKKENGEKEEEEKIEFEKNGQKRLQHKYPLVNPIESKPEETEEMNTLLSRRDYNVEKEKNIKALSKE